MRDVPALILAGGAGTRLRSVVPDLPKPLAPVEGRPFLTFLFDQLAAAGLRRVIVGIGYKAEMIRAALGTTYGPLSIQYSEESEPLGTGGAVRLALPLIGAENFLLLNGDSFCDASLSDFDAFHLAHGKPASLTAVQVPDASRYGRLEIAEDGRVEAFREKQAGAEPGWINAGIYLLRTRLLEEMPEGRAISLEREIFPRWLASGLMAWKTEGRFIDIGTPESYAQVAAIKRAGG